MGREKKNKPHRPRPGRRAQVGGTVPRLVDLPGLSAEEKKNMILSEILSPGSPLLAMTRAMSEAKYGAYTVSESDILDLPSPVREAALDELTTYAQMPTPPGPEELVSTAMETSRNASAALKRLLVVGSGARRQQAVEALVEESPVQALLAGYAWNEAGKKDEACFVCGDTEDTDWYRWTDSAKEGVLCADCVAIQTQMYSSGPGDHLVKVVRKP